MSNVPQDVMENTHKPDLIEKLSGLARSIEVCEGWRPTCIDEAIAKLRDQRAGGEAVGAAVTSPDDPGFTMACFEASDVPAGTKLFTQPQPTLDQRAGGEAVAYLDFNGELKPTRHGVITMKKGDNLYTEPQPTLDFAAGMMKAAEICEAEAEGSFAIAKSKVVTANGRDTHNAAGFGATNCAALIRSAIPNESADALKEYVSGKCMEVAQSVFRKKWNRELSVFAHEDELAAIVNSVLEGKS
jgi:hypothetical protein